jgi:hypothetical protein
MLFSFLSNDDKLLVVLSQAQDRVRQVRINGNALSNKSLASIHHIKFRKVYGTILAGTVHGVVVHMIKLVFTPSLIPWNCGDPTTGNFT